MKMVESLSLHASFSVPHRGTQCSLSQVTHTALCPRFEDFNTIHRDIIHCDDIHCDIIHCDIIHCGVSGYRWSTLAWYFLNFTQSKLVNQLWLETKPFLLPTTSKKRRLRDLWRFPQSVVRTLPQNSRRLAVFMCQPLARS